MEYTMDFQEAFQNGGPLKRRNQNQFSLASWSINTITCSNNIIHEKVTSFWLAKKECSSHVTLEQTTDCTRPFVSMETNYCTRNQVIIYTVLIASKIYSRLNYVYDDNDNKSDYNNVIVKSNFFRLELFATNIDSSSKFLIFRWPAVCLILTVNEWTGDYSLPLLSNLLESN